MGDKELMNAFGKLYSAGLVKLVVTEQLHGRLKRIAADEAMVIGASRDDSPELFYRGRLVEVGDYAIGRR